jgi:hypothetical protein
VRDCRPWKRDEVAFLVECSILGFTSDKLLPFLDRTAPAIRQKRRHLGILRPRRSRPPEPVKTRLSPYSTTQIKSAVCEAFDVPEAEMVSANRERPIARPRQVAMYLSRQLTTYSYPNIGRFFGNRDHTTVIHAVTQVTRLMGEDPLFKDKVETIRDGIVSKISPENRGERPISSFSENLEGA